MQEMHRARYEGCVAQSFHALSQLLSFPALQCIYQPNLTIQAFLQPTLQSFPPLPGEWWVALNVPTL